MNELSKTSDKWKLGSYEDKVVMKFFFLMMEKYI